MQTSGTMMPVMVDDIKKRASTRKDPCSRTFHQIIFEGEWNDKLTYPLLLVHPIIPLKAIGQNHESDA